MPTQPFAVPAIALFILAVPLVLGLIPRNRFYGFRTAATLSSDRLWYRANRAAGVAIMLASGVYGAVLVACPYNRAARDNFSTWAIHLAAFVVPLLIGLTLSARSARNH